MLTTNDLYLSFVETRINVGKVVIQIRHPRRIGPAIPFIGCVVEHRDAKSLGKNLLPNGNRISHSLHILNFFNSSLTMVGINSWASLRKWYHSPPVWLSVRSSKWTIGCTAFGAAFTVMPPTLNSYHLH